VFAHLILPVSQAGRDSIWLRRAAPLAAALAGLTLFLTGCGGPSGATAARAGATATGTASPSGPAHKSMVAFSACMRSHGLPKFPDPNSKGQLLITPNSGVDPNSPQFQAAQQACQSLAPQQSPAQAQQSQARILKFAACMRSHGVPNFPDPTFSGGHFQMRLPQGLDPSSPQFQSAQQACQSLAPFGGPGAP
jgi:hypothetical protein